MPLRTLRLIAIAKLWHVYLWKEHIQAHISLITVTGNKYTYVTGLKRRKVQLNELLYNLFNLLYNIEYIT